MRTRIASNAGSPPPIHGTVRPIPTATICVLVQDSVEPLQMRKRTRYSLLLVLALVGALIVALWLRRNAPPEAARLLPDSDAIVYANLEPIRIATHYDREPVPRSPDYQKFIDATGIVAERDLNAVAFALHRMDDPNGPNGPVAYSEVFEGKFDGARLAKYLGGIASSQEDYGGHTVYTVLIEGRPLRIAQLGYDTIAASNMPTTEQIYAMLDRYRAAASPFAGSSLLAARYRDVPLLSSVWAIGHVGLPFTESGQIKILGMSLPLREDTTFVVSLRYGVGGVHLRIEELEATEVDAGRAAGELGSLLHLIQAMQPVVSQHPLSAVDQGVRQLVDSVKVEQHKDRAVVTATVPVDLLKQLATVPKPPEP